MGGARVQELGRKHDEIYMYVKREKGEGVFLMALLKCTKFDQEISEYKLIYIFNFLFS